MKDKYILLAAIVLAATIVLCTQIGKGTGRKASPSKTTEMTMDSVVVKDNVGDFSMTAEFPKKTKTILANAIGEYVSESLGGTYSGETTDIHAILQCYLDSTLKEYHDMADEFQPEDMRFYYNGKFAKEYETPEYLSYMHTMESYAGGAHGSHSCFGITLRKIDGRRMGWDVFTKTYEEGFNNLLQRGLRQYWELGEEENLEDYLFEEARPYALPLPQCPPVFTKEGVMFIYNSYEIAPYAAGSPTFTVPYEDIKGYMTETARKLCGIS